MAENQILGEENFMAGKKNPGRGKFHGRKINPGRGKFHDQKSPGRGKFHGRKRNSGKGKFHGRKKILGEENFMAEKSSTIFWNRAFFLTLS
jgi:hypothetical protein